MGTDTAADTLKTRRVESGLDVVLLLDPEGTLLAWSPAAEALFRRHSDGGLGMPVARLLPDLGSVDDLWRRARCGEVIHTPGSSADSPRLRWRVRLAALERGDERLVVALVVDESSAERELDRAWQRQRLAAVGQLAAGIAHDFGNILGAISLYGELLHASPGMAEKARQRIEVILQQAQRGAALTSQILDFTRRSDVERRPLDMRRLLVETRELLRAGLPEAIDVEMTFTGERFVVDGDPARLQQAILNLAYNARDAMPGGGRLSIEAETFRLPPHQPPPYRDMPPGEWLRLRTSDTGAGIPPDILPHIFEPFFTTKPIHRGSGLGLAQVYGIVKRHAGYIEALSQPGHGTTFLIYLPLDGREPDRAPGRRRAFRAEGRGHAVLLVDADEGSRQAIAEVLAVLEYHVATAPSGAEALREIERGLAVDIVLCDASLADMTGEEFARQAAAMGPDLPVVLMSSYSPSLETRERPASGRLRWLTKPFTIDQVAQALAQAWGTERSAG